MTGAEYAIHAVLVVAVFVLAIFGLRLVVLGDPALNRVAHTPEALSRVLGGRYLAMAGMIAALLYLGDWPALTIALAAGAFMGLIDWWVEPADYALPHLLVALGCLLLAGAVYNALPA